MQNRKIGHRSHHRWHLRANCLFVVMIVGLLAACAIPNASSRPTPTPAQTLANLTVYDTHATADGGVLRALKADTGQLRWQAQTGLVAGGKPVIENGIVYAGSFDTVYAFKANNGTPLWSTQGYNLSTGPTVADGKVFVDYYTHEPDGRMTLSVGSLKGTDGTQLWRTPVDPQSVALPQIVGQVVANGVFYVAVAWLDPNVSASQFVLYAYKLNDGKLLWRSSSTPPGCAMLLVKNGVVFAYVDRLYAYKVSDGTLLWQSQGAVQPLVKVCERHDLLVDQASAYVDTPYGLTAYSTASGSQLWHVPVSWPRGQFLQAALANSVIYATLEDGVSALDARTGKQLWSYKAEQQFVTPLIDGNTLYVGDLRSGLVALGIHTGNLRWRVQEGGDGNRPTLVNGTLFVSDDSGVIAAVRASNGKVLWHFPTNSGVSLQSALTVA